jgi:hypothetical protein
MANMKKNEIIADGSDADMMKWPRCNSMKRRLPELEKK